MADPKPNSMVICPYNKSHHIEHYRMHVHLQKCRKQHVNCNKLTCPFDATHIVNDVELDYHVTVCPKRAMLDSKVYVMDDDYRPTVEVTPAPPPSSYEESWDDECTQSYKPDLSKKAPHIITKLKGATPSERRKWRMDCIKNYRAPDNADEQSSS